MAGRATEIRVGIAVLLALALVIFGVTWLSDLRLARSRIHYVVLFSDVGGLEKGDPVTVNGVRTGRVEEIHLAPSGVAVALAVDRSARLNKGTQIYVRNAGIIGEKFIAVDRVEGDEYWAPGDTILGVYESGVPEVISQMGDALTSLQRVSDQLDRILVLAEERGTVRTTLQNVERASNDVAATLAENRRDFREITENLKEMSFELRMLVAEKSPVVDETVERLAVTSGRIDTLVTHLDGLADNIERITAKMEADTTTVGRILADRELYDDFRSTLREVNLLMKDVKQNPRKYFNFSLF